ncbi:MAG TPA: DUF2934 domain-containing protein [Candidatus Angelobacter sp.]|nr:DUF2934 domain-containing protein [Candidatus Angelobacter sp.]
MATKPPVNSPRKTSSSKKSVTKQPTPINSYSNATITESAPTPSPQPMMEEEIRRRAYELYEERGRQHGFEQEDWARAEAEIRSKYQQEKSA